VIHTEEVNHRGWTPMTVTSDAPYKKLIG